MSRNTMTMTENVLDYLANVGVREDRVLTKCRTETAVMPNALMQISPEQGGFMQMLVRLIRAHRCIEVGVFTGYSSLAVALALPADGHITALDVSEEYTSKARKYWKEAGVDKMIDLHVAPATETLQKLIEEGAAGSYDFAFIDADKPGYDAYYEACLELLRPGGLIAIDNVLWSGNVADPEATDENTMALKALNQKVHDDERVDMALVPIGDGLTLALKRQGH
ncbi:MAG: methyltransferase domain-containing protein [Sphingomonadales bacterium]|nr:MAG: methyltransferase domain-containing protein [Sphingomonadales bacterium]